MPCRIVVEGDVATLRVTVFDRKAGAPIPVEWREELEEQLTDEARKLLASDDVAVTLSWPDDSLEIAALIACGKVVADVGAFLTGVRQIGDDFPERIHGWLSDRLGPHVVVRKTALEMGRGLLRGKAEDSTDGGDATASSPMELATYAVLSLVVLVVVAALVIVGVVAFL